MVLVGAGVLFPLLWPLKAAAPSAAVAAAPKSEKVDPTVQGEPADLNAAAACDIEWADIPPFSSSAIIEADAVADPAPAAGRLIAYTWTGNNDTDWNDSGNWSSAGGGYPDDCDDDATVPSGTWDITLVALQIDDLEISGNVDFDGSAQSPPVLKADSITLSGSGAITLTFTSSCTLKTFGCP